VNARIAVSILALLGLLAASPVASATHSQPAVDRGILKTLWKPVGFFKPGDPIPMPSAPPAPDANGMYNPSGHYSAYDTNVFESLNFPGRQAGDTTNNDKPGSGDLRFGYCPPDPKYMPQGRCANHALEYLDFYERTMKDMLKDFGGTVHRYEFFNPGSGGTPVGAPAGLSTPEGITYNIAAVVPGADHPEQEVIVSGHWDFTDAAPAAAWDSSEGHAEVMRMAKIMTDYWRATGTRPSATVKFAPWGAEESGTYGSRDYVERHIVEGEGSRIRAYFNVDPCAGAYPAYYHGNPGQRVPMVLQLSNPEEATEPERVIAFNEKATKVIDEFYADIDDTIAAANGPQPVFTDADRDEIVVALGGLLAFNSDYANFESIGVPIMNLFPDMFGPHADGTPASSEGVGTIHTPRDNLQSLNALTTVDQTGLTASDGWMKGMELCAHLESRYMLQPEMGGTQAANVDPVAYFEPLPYRNNYPKGKLMTFDASGSYQYNQLATRGYTPDSDLEYAWDFGDKSGEAVGKTVKHAFKSGGLYTVTLTVTNLKTKQSDTMKTNVSISEDGDFNETDPDQRRRGGGGGGGGTGGFDPGAQAANSLLACQSAADTGFSSLKVSRAGKGLKFEGVARGGNGAFLAEVFQVAKGRSATKPRKVASFTVNRSLTWNGKPKKGKLTPGTYFARVTARGTGARPDVRGFALTRSKSSFKLRKPFQRADTCSEISLFRLDSPAFGPKRKLTASFTLTKPGTATVEVFRGKKRVKRITRKVPSANRLQKVAISPKKLKRGEYRIVLKAAGKSETLNARRY
jgi:PKD repeat protein